MNALIAVQEEVLILAGRVGPDLETVPHPEVFQRRLQARLVNAVDLFLWVIFKFFELTEGERGFPADDLVVK